MSSHPPTESKLTATETVSVICLKELSRRRNVIYKWGWYGQEPSREVGSTLKGAEVEDGEGVLVDKLHKMATVFRCCELPVGRPVISLFFMK
jgi:hypothetical protein